MNRYFLDHVQVMQGYTPGEQPTNLGVIKLNTNENPYPPSPKVAEALAAFDAESLRKYSDPLALGLREAAARCYGFESADWVFAGNGMDEALALTVRTFADPGDAILTPYPTYSLYEVLAKLHGAECRFVDLTPEFELPAAFLDTPARLVFLPRPNAPTGVAAPIEQVERICKQFEGLVFIDEAYVDFADGHCLGLVKRFDNVIVGRTCSKSFSLAGLRLGFAFAQPDTIAEFMKTKDSYNLNALTQALGTAALSDPDWTAANAKKIRATRYRLTATLRALGFRVPESQANFVLALWEGQTSAHRIFERLRTDGILVRYFDAPRLEKALRITVGTDTETGALLDALRGICG